MQGGSLGVLVALWYNCAFLATACEGQEPVGCEPGECVEVEVLLGVVWGMGEMVNADGGVYCTVGARPRLAGRGNAASASESSAVDDIGWRLGSVGKDASTGPRSLSHLTSPVWLTSLPLPLALDYHQRYGYDYGTV